MTDAVSAALDRPESIADLQGDAENLAMLRVLVRAGLTTWDEWCALTADALPVVRAATEMVVRAALASGDVEGATTANANAIVALRAFVESR